MLAAGACPCLLAGVLALGGKAPGDWRTYESKFYVVETNLPAKRAEFIGRVMDATGKEYDRRFQGFRGVVKEKPRLVVFAAREQYVEHLVRETGEQAVVNTSGVFNPGDGVVYSFEGPSLESTLKHECFHQFAHLVIGGRLPSWANEGLAEFFAEGVFDEKSGELRLGAVPKHRVDTFAKAKAGGTLLSIEHLLHVDQATWNDHIGASGSIQYSQAWALCHFLVYGDGNKYRGMFDQFLRLVDRGFEGGAAWRQVFGADTAALQKRYEEYLAQLKPSGPLRE